jgi:hypothetical protein
MIYKIEELLEMSADELEKMSDEELKKYFEPYFDVVRPERAKVLAPIVRATQSYIPPAKRKALSKLASMDIDMDLFARKKKK